MIFNWDTIVPIFQCLAAIGTIAAASAAWYTARLNKQSSLRMEKQVVQAEKEKHSAVKPMLYVSGVTYSDNGFVLRVKQKGSQIYHPRKAEWEGNEGVTAVLESFIVHGEDSLSHEIKIGAEKSKFPIEGKIKIIYKNLYGKMDSQSIDNIVYKGRSDPLKNLSNKLFK